MPEPWYRQIVDDAHRALHNAYAAEGAAVNFGYYIEAAVEKALAQAVQAERGENARMKDWFRGAGWTEKHIEDTFGPNSITALRARPAEPTGENTNCDCSEPNGHAKNCSIWKRRPAR